jgi:hypothetical protein
MTRAEFTSFVEQTLENVILYAERETGKTLSRNIRFRWITQKEAIRDGIVEAIVSRVFVSEDQIYPCVDIVVAELSDDGTPIIKAYISGHQPRPFQKNWTGTDGPFVFGIGQRLLDQLGGKKPAS